MKYERIGRMMFGMAVACGLAMGTTEALASPRAPERTVTYCENYPSQTPCTQFCQSLGYDRGYCASKYDDCHCYNI